MGAVVSALTRRIQRFNFENKVHREISKDKPTPAPPYPSTIREIERAKENSQFIEEQSQKNPKLVERLKNVYLISQDVKEETISKATGPEKLLPVTRSKHEETDFGFFEPKMIPRGRVTLRQALKFLAEYQSDPKKSAAVTIASRHNLTLEMTENILKYFRTFEVVVPEAKEVAGSRITVTQIEGGKETQEK